MRLAFGQLAAARGTARGTGTGMPPFNSTGGDLVDQLRDWLERLRERVAGGGDDAPARRSARRTTMRSQAVPLGSPQARAAGPRRDPERRVGTADRAERGAYTLVFAAVLVALLLGLFFALSWVLGLGGPFGASPSPAPPPTAPPAAGQLPNPAPISSPGPFVIASPSPSPSPSPEPGLGSPPPAGRVHVVEAGDTLNRLAQRYGVTVEAIMQANGFADRNRILRIGERLVIPDAPAPTVPPR